MTNGNLFHRILVIPALHQINRTIGSLPYQVAYLKATNEFIPFALLQLLEVSHVRKVLLYLLKTYQRSLFIEHFKQRDVSFELTVEVADIDKGTEERWREYHLESLPILFDAVHEAKAS